MSTPTTTSSRKKPMKKSIANGNMVFFGVAIALLLVVSLGIFYVLQQVSATVTYYVLNQEVPARSQITPEMLDPVVTSVGGAPLNALDIGAVSAEPTFAKYALDAGDIVTYSNTGPQSPITEGIPEDFVAGSFQAPAETAVAGKIKRGDYIDVIAVGEAGEEGASSSKFVLRRVLVLDTAATLESSVDESGAAESEDPEAGATRTGVPTIYTVALPKEDAAKLALLQDVPLSVVLTSRADVEKGADPADISASAGKVFGGEEVGDSGVGTDNTFGDATDDEEKTEEGTASAEEEAPATDATEEENAE